MICIFEIPLCVGRGIFRTRNVMEGIMYIIHGKRLDEVFYARVWSTVLQPNALEDIVVVTL
jgi:hypothetical protein